MGKEESSAEESFESGLLEYPHYTRPREWEGRAIPDVLLSGDHAKIADMAAGGSRADHACETAGSEARLSPEAADRHFQPTSTLGGGPNSHDNPSMRRSRLSLASGACRARLDGSVAAGKSRRWVPFLSESLPNAAIGLPKTSKTLQFPAKNCNSLPGIGTYQGLTGGGKKKTAATPTIPFSRSGLLPRRPCIGVGLEIRQDRTRGRSPLRRR